MLWGSDIHSNPVQMVVEGWLYLGFSSPMCSLLDWLNKLWTGLLQKLWSSTAAKKVDENYFISIALIGNWRCYAHVMKTSLTGTPRILSLAWLGWYADSRLRHTAGLLFVLRLKFWSLCSRTTLYSCKGQNRWQSAHELMSSQAREISALKKCANLCTLDAAVTLVSMLLWLQLSSVVMLDCHLILIKIKIISGLLEKKTIWADFWLNAVWS